MVEARGRRRSSSRSSSAVIGFYGFLPFYTDGSVTFFDPSETDGAPFFTFLGWAIGIGIVAAIVGILVLLFVRRDLGVAYVALAGLV